MAGSIYPIDVEETIWGIEQAEGPMSKSREAFLRIAIPIVNEAYEDGRSGLMGCYPWLFTGGIERFCEKNGIRPKSANMLHILTENVNEAFACGQRIRAEEAEMRSETA